MRQYLLARVGGATPPPPGLGNLAVGERLGNKAKLERVLVEYEVPVVYRELDPTVPPMVVPEFSMGNQIMRAPAPGPLELDFDALSEADPFDRAKQPGIEHSSVFMGRTFGIDRYLLDHAHHAHGVLPSTNVNDHSREIDDRELQQRFRYAHRAQTMLDGENFWNASGEMQQRLLPLRPKSPPSTERGKHPRCSARCGYSTRSAAAPYQQLVRAGTQ